MLHLPPGQGISIYSLASVLPLLAGQAAPDAHERLDDDGRRDRLPRSELRLAAAHHAARACAGSAMPKPPRCRSMTTETTDAANPAGARTTRSRASSAAAGSWPAATARCSSDDPIADMVAFADAGITTFDCADIYTGVEELIGRVPRCATASCAARRRCDRIKVHTKFVPDLDMLPTHHQGLRRRRHRPVACGGCKTRAARPRAVPLVGLCRAALAGDGAVAGRAAARRQDRQGQRHQFRHRPHAGDGRRPACR